MNCPLCASVHVEAFLVRDDVPVHQNLLFDSAEAATGSARGQLRMSVCVVMWVRLQRRFRRRPDHLRTRIRQRPDLLGLFRPIRRISGRRTGGARRHRRKDDRGDRLRDRLLPAQGRRCGERQPRHRIRSELQRRGGERGRHDRIRADDFYRGDGRARRRRRDLPARDRASARSVGTGVGSARPSQPPRRLWYSKRHASSGSCATGVVWDFFYEHCSSVLRGLARDAVRAVRLRGAACEPRLQRTVFVARRAAGCRCSSPSPRRSTRSSANAGGSEISNVGPSRSGANRWRRRPHGEGSLSGAPVRRAQPLSTSSIRTPAW